MMGPSIICFGCLWVCKRLGCDVFALRCVFPVFSMDRSINVGIEWQSNKTFFAFCVLPWLHVCVCVCERFHWSDELLRPVSACLCTYRGLVRLVSSCSVCLCLCVCARARSKMSFIAE